MALRCVRGLCLLSHTPVSKVLDADVLVTLSKCSVFRPRRCEMNKLTGIDIVIVSVTVGVTFRQVLYNAFIRFTVRIGRVVSRVGRYPLSLGIVDPFRSRCPHSVLV